VRLALVLQVLVFAAAGCRTAPQAPRTRFPPARPPALGAEAEGLVENNCLACHSVDMLAQQRLTRAQWDAAVKKMRKWGAPLEEENEAPLVEGLAAVLSQEAPPYEPTHVWPGDAEAAVLPLPDGAYAGGDARRGAALFTESCAACHGAEGRGGTMGVNLVDRPRLYRAEEWAGIVRAGKGRMPSYDALTDGEIASLLAYLRGVTN
jgi:mono/diheme cytochrome c family protein